MKTKMKHMPGPWRTSEANAADIDIVSHKGELIATVHCEGRPKQAPYNAALISSAPEMLEALKYAKEIVQENCPDDVYDDPKYSPEAECLVKIKAAIAKAEASNAKYKI